MNSGLELKELKQLIGQQIRELKRLEISDQQMEFGGSFKRSIDECLSGSPNRIRGLGILFDGSPIGLVVLKRPPLSPAWASEDTVTLHGLKIDIRWQGKGYGRDAFSSATAFCKSIWPDAKQLALSVDAENQVALSLYKSFGMTDSGPVYQGRIGLEHRLQIALE